MVTDALSASARPLSVVTAELPAVENVTPADAMMVPTIVPPPAALIVAAVPTYQYTFLACAPLIRMMLRGSAGPPAVSERPNCHPQIALPAPCLPKVRPEPVSRNEP